jgi:hypothetical protein
MEAETAAWESKSSRLDRAKQQNRLWPDDLKTANAALAPCRPNVECRATRAFRAGARS